MVAQTGCSTRRTFLRKLYLVGTTVVVTLPAIAASSYRPGGFGLTANAASASTLSGRAFDVLTNRPVPGAKVVVQPSGTVATSDANGDYAVVLQAEIYSID